VLDQVRLTGNSGGYQAAPPTKRANLNKIPVRLYDGALPAHVQSEFADRLLETGYA